MRGLLWFREDLRLTDNTALFHAQTECHDGIQALYVIDPHAWRQHDTAACRVEFILRGLHQLKADLAQYHIPLFVVTASTPQELSSAVLQLMTTQQLEVLYFNKQYEINESRRDATLTLTLAEKNICVHSFDDQVIVAPGSIKTGQRQPFRIFTPYKNAWLHHVEKQPIRLLPAPQIQTFDGIASTPPKTITGFKSTVDATLWPAGETAAQHRLNSFTENVLHQYDKTRDFPALKGTSQLSPYLASGMISPRHCFVAALHANDNELQSGNLGARTWMSELIWREFYKHLLSEHPRLSMHQPFKSATATIAWDTDEALFKAWQLGQTGYPLIDAAMRQLRTIGWMHNRLRMVVAMFLTKNLFLPWVWGEKYFMSQLIDGDLAANNGGWQWSASTGTDAAPYFRIFNPIRQSERFDPEGEFIKQYCPELNELTAKSIHEPYAYAPLIAAQSGYPRAILALNDKRERVLAAFKLAGRD